MGYSFFETNNEECLESDYDTIYLNFRSLEARIVLDASADFLVDHVLDGVASLEEAKEAFSKDKDYDLDPYDSDPLFKFFDTVDAQKKLFSIPTPIKDLKRDKVSWLEKFTSEDERKQEGARISTHSDKNLFHIGNEKDDVIHSVKVVLDKKIEGDTLYFWQYDQTNGFVHNGFVPCFEAVQWFWDDDVKTLKIQGAASVGEYEYILEDLCFTFSAVSPLTYRNIFVTLHDIDGNKISAFNFSIDFFVSKPIQIENVSSRIVLTGHDPVPILQNMTIEKNATDLLVSLELSIENYEKDDQIYPGRATEVALLHINNLEVMWNNTKKTFTIRGTHYPALYEKILKDLYLKTNLEDSLNQVRLLKMVTTNSFGKQIVHEYKNEGPKVFWQNFPYKSFIITEPENDLISSVEIILTKKSPKDRLYFWSDTKVNGFENEGSFSDETDVVWFWDDRTATLTIKGNVSPQKYTTILNSLQCIFLSEEGQDLEKSRSLSLKAMDIYQKYGYPYQFLFDFSTKTGSVLSSVPFTNLIEDMSLPVPIFEDSVDIAGKDEQHIHVYAATIMLKEYQEGDELYVADSFGQPCLNYHVVDAYHLQWEWYDDAKALTIYGVASIYDYEKALSYVYFTSSAPNITKNYVASLTVLDTYGHQVSTTYDNSLSLERTWLETYLSKIKFFLKQNDQIYHQCIVICYAIMR